MNILVLSDSHGNISNMEEAVEREKPDMILHLGDCWRDAERLAERYPDIPMEHVPGNCDCRPEEPGERLLFLGDCRVLICDGPEGRAGPFRCLSVWPYPQAFGGQAGQNAVPESGNCGQGPAAYLRYINGRGRPDRWSDRVFGYLNIKPINAADKNISKIDI